MFLIKDEPSVLRTVPQQESDVFAYGLRVFDTKTNELRWLINAPAFPDWMAWSADSKTVLVDGVLSSSNTLNTAGVEAVTVDIRSGRRLVSHIGRFVAVDGLQELSALRIARAGSSETRLFRLLPARDSLGLLPDRSADPAIELVQDFQNPPRLANFNPATTSLNTIYDLNPGLQHKINPVNEVSWHTADGEVMKGGLYFPSNYVPGNRYPLVVQTHGWERSEFWYDGPSSAGFAAQSLASLGFMVAQVGDVESSLSTAQEGAAGTEMLDSLIDELDRRGLIDTSRLGVTAWSRTGLFVRYALEHGRHRFGAAALIDSDDGGFLNYLLNPKTVQDDMEHSIGAPPYGTGLTAWQAHSPTFGLEKVDTPVRLIKLGPHVLDQWEDWASLRRLGKAVEFIWLPSANHWPIKPKERLEVQQGTVDWMSYWLLREHSASPVTAEEYSRWDMLRASNDLTAGQKR
jgi:dipeptidyl aminopeptidase/acylaminoacyl peptidase